jgi:Glycine cleavage H-protein
VPGAPSAVPSPTECARSSKSSTRLIRRQLATFRYSKEHQWVNVKSDIGTIGLTDYAQAQLDEIVSVELPKPGATLDAGKALGSV